MIDPIVQYSIRLAVPVVSSIMEDISKAEWEVTPPKKNKKAEKEWEFHWWSPFWWYMKYIGIPFTVIFLACKLIF
jgi:hypothetical protein